MEKTVSERIRVAEKARQRAVELMEKPFRGEAAYYTLHYLLHCVADQASVLAHKHSRRFRAAAELLQEITAPIFHSLIRGEGCATIQLEWPADLLKAVKEPITDPRVEALRASLHAFDRVFENGKKIVEALKEASETGQKICAEPSAEISEELKAQMLNRIERKPAVKFLTPEEWTAKGRRNGFYAAVFKKRPILIEYFGCAGVFTGFNGMLQKPTDLDLISEDRSEFPK